MAIEHIQVPLARLRNFQVPSHEAIVCFLVATEKIHWEVVMVHLRPVRQPSVREKRFTTCLSSTLPCCEYVKSNSKASKEIEKFYKSLSPGDWINRGHHLQPVHNPAGFDCAKQREEILQQIIKKSLSATRPNEPHFTPTSPHEPHSISTSAYDESCSISTSPEDEQQVTLPHPRDETSTDSTMFCDDFLALPPSTPPEIFLKKFRLGASRLLDQQLQRGLEDATCNNMTPQYMSGQQPDLEEIVQRLNSIQKERSSSAKSDCWMLEHLIRCTRNLQRKRGSLRKLGDSARACQIRQETSASQINAVVDRLVPYIGPLALVAYSVLALMNFKWNEARRPSTSGDRPDDIQTVVEGILHTGFKVHKTARLFNPVSILSLLLQEDYECLCDEFGLQGFSALPHSSSGQLLQETPLEDAMEGAQKGSAVLVEDVWMLKGKREDAAECYNPRKRKRNEASHESTHIFGEGNLGQALPIPPSLSDAEADGYSQADMADSRMNGPQTTQQDNSLIQPSRDSGRSNSEGVALGNIPGFVDSSHEVQHRLADAASDCTWTADGTQPNMTSYETMNVGTNWNEWASRPTADASLSHNAIAECPRWLEQSVLPGDMDNITQLQCLDGTINPLLLRS